MAALIRLAALGGIAHRDLMRRFGVGNRHLRESGLVDGDGTDVFINDTGNQVVDELIKDFFMVLRTLRRQMFKILVVFFSTH